MARLSEFYFSALRDCRGNPPPNFDDTSRGCLLALLADRPTIWNTTARLTKDDVLASFNQCSAILSNMDPNFSIWAIIEKWCWIVESYVRCSLTKKSSEWRYNNTLEFLKPFASITYPYMGCLSKKRLEELTKLYADPEITKVMEETKDLEVPAGGFFRDEMAFLAEEEIPVALEKTVGQVVNGRRRGRPSKADKFQRLTAEAFAAFNPNVAQIQKFLENSGIASSSYTIPEPDVPDEFGFTVTMYNALIEMIQDKPELWQVNHPQKDDSAAHDLIYDEIAKKLIIKFKVIMDVSRLDSMTGTFVRIVWERMKQKFAEEEKLIESGVFSKWRYFPSLQFLSTQLLMPAFNLDGVFIKSEDPSGLSSRVAVGSPAGSSQSEDSRMATSSPATSAQFSSIPNMVNGNKSIKAVLDNLVARSMKEEQGNIANVIQPADYTELKQILDQNKTIKTEIDSGPPVKRGRTDNSPPSGARMVLYSDSRKATQAPISTWVPPREDLAAKVKEETVSTPPPKRAQATAVIKSGFPLEKQLKKMLQQTVPSFPVTPGSISAARNGLLGLSSVIPQSALQQALLKKMEPTTSVATAVMTTASTSASQLHHSHMNGSSNGTSETEDKWGLLGRMITMMAREIESRDPVSACELFRDLQQVICSHQMKSLLPKENNP